MNWAEDWLARWADLEAHFWPSVYLAPNLLAEAIWYALNVDMPIDYGY